MSRAHGLHLHFDPQSGIAGDMTVAALVDAGVPRKVVTAAVAAMKVPGLKARFEKRKRGAFMGTGFVVTWPGQRKASRRPARPAARLAHAHFHPLVARHDHDHAGDDHDHDHDHASPDHDHADNHRDYAEIRRLLSRARIPGEARRLAEEIFRRIAEVEAELHGVPVARVAFHEVGAYDSIADVVGAAAAIAHLAPSSVSATAPVLGTGSVATAHGRVAVPAPATAALLAGIPTRSEGHGELTTPTGAAILAAVVDEFGPPPPMRLAGQGFGAGTRELSDRPNVLRVLLGVPLGAALGPSAPDVLLVQANIDDMSPQLVEPLATALFAVGAVDVWSTPIVMKKGRPALEVSALVAADLRPALEQAFFRHSTTLGVRVIAANRTVLGRSIARVKTRFGPVTVKLAALDGVVIGAAPEFEDCKRLAARAKVPVREVWTAASAAAAPLVASHRMAGR